MWRKVWLTCSCEASHPSKDIAIAHDSTSLRQINILLYCKIASGDYSREEVLIPRIEIKHYDEQFIKWNRRQFPVIPAFAMTINKSQDQILISGNLAGGGYIHSWAALWRGLCGSLAGGGYIHSWAALCRGLCRSLAGGGYIHSWQLYVAVYVGVWLEEATFTHGQLYVAAWRRLHSLMGSSMSRPQG